MVGFCGREGEQLSQDLVAFGHVVVCELEGDAFLLELVDASFE